MTAGGAATSLWKAGMLSRRPTRRLASRSEKMMITPPNSEESGPVIAGCTAFATSSTKTRSKRVNWPTSRLPKIRRPASRAT